jgi:hypothetical protein
MENQFIFPGTSSDDIDNFIENDSNVKEGNERFYTYPQYLYELLLQRKDINIEFNKPNNMKINNYYYELTRAFHMLFSEIVTELGNVCDSKTCPRMTAGQDWEYKCMNHGNPKSNPNCSAIDYCIHTLDTTMPLLSHPAFYPDRDKISDHSASALIKMVRYLYRILAHIYFHHRKLYDSLEFRYRIDERLTLYCKKFNIIEKPKEHYIKI